MRAIASGEAKHGFATLEILNYTTFGSLIKRKYVTIDKRNNPMFTPLGHAAYETYKELDMPTRSHPGKVTETVALMLGLKEANEKRVAAAS